MAYPYISAGQPIQSPPKNQFIDAVQENVNQNFYASSDWWTIQEETSLASGIYQNVDARINYVVNVSTGEKIGDDFKKLLFMNLQHPVDLGRLYIFEDNYWVTVNVDKIKSLTQTATVRRCNNTLRWMDEDTGAVYESPCSIGYLIKENRDYSTAGSSIVVPSGMIECITQFNTTTNRIKPNQRFLFGNANNWSAWRVEGGGINNFNNLETNNNTSSGLIKFSLAVDYVNPQTDDVVNGIANVVENAYVLMLNQSTISGNATQTVQLVATVTLNGNAVTRNLTWLSSDTSIATVSTTGLVTFVAEGNAVITCRLSDNNTVSDTTNVTVTTSPVDNYQVIISPSTNYILEGEEITWSMYLYKNGVQQADTFSFVLNANTVPSTKYIYTVLGGNTFKIHNYGMYLTDELEVTGTSGIYSNSITISLRGAW